ncbi:MAG: alcohol dehydrogenase catalytic domain-containing protein [Thermoleophilia bacterium]
MRAMLLEEYGRPLRPVELEVPAVGPEDALVRVRACGVCRTDVKIRDGEIPAPIVTLPHVPGHEAAGEVVTVGEAVSGVAPGDRVVVYLSVCCGRCRACGSGRENLCPTLTRVGFELQGAFAEYLVVPAKQLLPIPDSLPFEQAGVLTDAVVVPYHALKRQASVGVGDTVLVVGVGGIGIHAVQLAKAAGVRVIAADVDEGRLALAGELGADHLIDPRSVADPTAAVRDLTDGAGVDAVVDNVGSAETVAWALPTMRKGGKLVIVGYTPGRPFTVDSMAMHYNEWEIIGSRLATKQELAGVVDLVGRGLVKPWVTRTFSLDEANLALDELARDAIVGRATLVL